MVVKHILTTWKMPLFLNFIPKDREKQLSRDTSIASYESA